VRSDDDRPVAGNPYRAADAWGNEVAQRWIACEAALDLALGPFGKAALDRARPAAGQRVLDVGCGTGSTTAALADAVGPRGHVLGLDIAPALLLRARQRLMEHPQAELQEADAQTVLLAQDRDLVFSRFGVMFFADARSAFHNLAATLRPGGRMTFVCWRRFEDNPWQSLAHAALRQVMPEVLPPTAEGPGPHSLADPAKLQQLIADAGLVELAIDRVDHQVCLGVDLTSALHFALNTGPTARALSGADPYTLFHVRDRIAVALARCLGKDGVCLDASAWLVDARAR
jgi:SAM-dependent methyltransferase